MNWETKVELVKHLNNDNYEDIKAIILNNTFDVQALDMFISGIELMPDLVDKLGIEALDKVLDRFDELNGQFDNFRGEIRFEILRSLFRGEA